MTLTHMWHYSPCGRWDSKARVQTRVKKHFMSIYQQLPSKNRRQVNPKPANLPPSPPRLSQPPGRDESPLNAVFAVDQEWVNVNDEWVWKGASSTSKGSNLGVGV